MTTILQIAEGTTGNSSTVTLSLPAGCQAGSWCVALIAPQSAARRIREMRDPGGGIFSFDQELQGNSFHAAIAWKELTGSGAQNFQLDLENTSGVPAGSVVQYKIFEIQGPVEFIGTDKQATPSRPYYCASVGLSAARDAVFFGCGVHNAPIGTFQGNTDYNNQYINVVTYPAYHWQNFAGGRALDRIQYSSTNNRNNAGVMLALQAPDSGGPPQDINLGRVTEQEQTRTLTVEQDLSQIINIGRVTEGETVRPAVVSITMYSYNQLRGIYIYAPDQTVLCRYYVADEEASTDELLDTGGLNDHGEVRPTGSRVVVAGDSPGAWIPNTTDFTSHNGWLDVTNPVDFSDFSELTVTCWVRMARFIQNNAFASNWGSAADVGSILFRVNSNGSIAGFLNTEAGNNLGGKLSNDGVVTLNNWHHVAIRWKDGILTGFVDGQEELSIPVAGGSLNDGDPDGLWMGGAPFNVNHMFQGEICDWGLFRRGLSDVEIDHMYTGPEPFRTGGTVPELDNNGIYTPGTWFSLAINGPLRIEWELRDEVGDPVITGTDPAGPIDLSAFMTFGEFYTIFERGVNGSGFDNYDVLQDRETPLTQYLGQTVNIGRVTEQETVRAVTVLEGADVAIGRVDEGETVRSLAVIPAQIINVGRVDEGELVRPVTVLTGNDVLLGRVDEGELVRSLAVELAGLDVALGRVLEGETTRFLSLDLGQNIALGRVTEGETVRALAVDSDYDIALGRALERETVRSLNIINGTDQIINVDRVLEVAQVRPLGLVYEQTPLLDRVLEGESVRPVQVLDGKMIFLGRTLEGEVVRPVFVSITELFLGRVLEGENARPIRIEPPLNTGLLWFYFHKKLG